MRKTGRVHTDEFRPPRQSHWLSTSATQEEARESATEGPELQRLQRRIRGGEGQSLEKPFGHADPGELFAWAGATASWPNRTDPGGSRGLDDYLTRDFGNNIGAEIMGRNKFGPQRGPWQDHEWLGWWGEEPPSTPRCSS